MKSIFEELWYGNICPNSGCREGTKEVRELMGYLPTTTTSFSEC